jgi:hypothetical protein
MMMPQSGFPGLGGQSQDALDHIFSSTVKLQYLSQLSLEARDRVIPIVVAGSRITSAGFDQFMGGSCFTVAQVEQKQGSGEMGAVYHSSTICKSSSQTQIRDDQSASGSLECRLAREQLVAATREDFEFIKSKVKMLCYEH